MKKLNINFKSEKNKKETIKINYWLVMAVFNLGVILLILLVYMFISNFLMTDVARNYESTVSKIKHSLRYSLIRTAEIDIKTNSFEHTKEFISLFKKENIFKYIYLAKIDNSSVNGETVIAGEKNQDMLEDTAINKASRQIGNYVIYYGTLDEDKSNDVINAFRSSMKAIMIILLIASVIATIWVSRRFTKPLAQLSSAAKEIANGNFGVKLEESDFIEINDMISSYNEMGNQLNELYSSLEQKVQERTIALEEANEKLKETQAMMVHSEKMRSLGELVAGIAHEINNPVNFIHGNIMILQNYADDLIGLIDEFSEHEDELKPEDKEKIEKIKKQIDLDFLRDDIKDLIKSCVEGTQRTKNIVLDLKNFSRMEEMVLTQFDIPKEIDTTLNILNNKYKNRITVIKNYSPDTPKIEAYGGQLNQVFMNILDNAQDAIADTGTLTINVDRVGENVKIEFIDTGSGIPEENLKKVFDPFFTTKAVGKGTGLGMSISYRVIKDHNGTIDVSSKVGVGTKFTIILPINHESKDKETETKKETV